MADASDNRNTRRIPAFLLEKEDLPKSNYSKGMIDLNILDGGVAANRHRQTILVGASTPKSYTESKENWVSPRLDQLLLPIWDNG